MNEDRLNDTLTDDMEPDPDSDDKLDTDLYVSSSLQIKRRLSCRRMRLKPFPMET